MKKFFSKSIAALLCALLAISVFAAMPVTAEAAVNLYAISVTIDEPVAGQTPSFSAEYPAEVSAWTNVSTFNRVNGINWYDVTDKVYLKKDVDTFKANHSYRVSIMVQANDGYSFSSFIQKSDVTINGNAVNTLATPQGQNNNKVLDLNYTFPALQATSLTTLNILIHEPRANNKPSYSATYLQGAEPYTQGDDQMVKNGVDWQNADNYQYLDFNTGTFELGCTYEAHFAVKAAEGYVFDENMNAYVNGHKASISTLGSFDSSEAAFITYKFPAIEPEKYNIYLAGIQLTELNKDNIAQELSLRSNEAMENYNSGKMKISYDPDENILYLKDAIIDTADVTAQGATFGEENLTVVLEGGNKIYGRAVNGIKLTESATITGDGYLSVYGKNDAVSYQKGEYFSTKLTIENTSVNFSGSDGIIGGAESTDILSIIFSDVDFDCENEGANYLGRIDLKDCYIAYPFDAAIKYTGTYCGVYSEGSIAKNFVIRQSGTLGDVNGDGTVDILDAALIQKHTVGKVDLSYKQLTLADVNGDGTVDILDAAMIQKYAVNKIDFFPGGKG